MIKPLKMPHPADWTAYAWNFADEIPAYPVLHLAIAPGKIPQIQEQLHAAGQWLIRTAKQPLKSPRHIDDTSLLWPEPMVEYAELSLRKTDVPLAFRIEQKRATIEGSGDALNALLEAAANTTESGAPDISCNNAQGVAASICVWMNDADGYALFGH